MVATSDRVATSPRNGDLFHSIFASKRDDEEDSVMSDDDEEDDDEYDYERLREPSGEMEIHDVSYSGQETFETSERDENSTMDMLNSQEEITIVTDDDDRDDIDDDNREDATEYNDEDTYETGNNTNDDRAEMTLSQDETNETGGDDRDELNEDREEMMSSYDDTYGTGNDTEELNDEHSEVVNSYDDTYGTGNDDDEMDTMDTEGRDTMSKEDTDTHDETNPTVPSHEKNEKVEKGGTDRVEIMRMMITTPERHARFSSDPPVTDIHSIDDDGFSYRHGRDDGASLLSEETGFTATKSAFVSQTIPVFFLWLDRGCAWAEHPFACGGTNDASGEHDNDRITSRATGEEIAFDDNPHDAPIEEQSLRENATTEAPVAEPPSGETDELDSPTPVVHTQASNLGTVEPKQENEMSTTEPTQDNVGGKEVSRSTSTQPEGEGKETTNTPKPKKEEGETKEVTEQEVKGESTEPTDIPEHKTEKVEEGEDTVARNTAGPEKGERIKPRTTTEPKKAKGQRKERTKTGERSKSKGERMAAPRPGSEPRKVKGKQMAATTEEPSEDTKQHIRNVVLDAMTKISRTVDPGASKDVQGKTESARPLRESKIVARAETGKTKGGKKKAETGATSPSYRPDPPVSPSAKVAKSRPPKTNNKTTEMSKLRDPAGTSMEEEPNVHTTMSKKSRHYFSRENPPIDAEVFSQLTEQDQIAALEMAKKLTDRAVQLRNKKRSKKQNQLKVLC